MDICKNYHGGNDRSNEAHRVAKLSADTMRREIWEMILLSDGLTCEEIEIKTGWKHQTVSARISELKRDNLLMVVGKRATSSGCTAAVYAVPYSAGVESKIFSKGV